jgi:type I restriction enzyme, S subunit
MKINIGNDLYLKGRIGWKGLSKDEYLEKSNYRIINGYSLKDGYIDWDIAGYISKERYEESPEIKLEINDILISKDGTIGKVGIVRDLGLPSTVASGIFVLRNVIEDRLDTEYLFQYLKSSNFKNFINRVKASGSTIIHLYQRDLIKLEIDVPSLKEQKLISSLLKNLDAKIELNNKINVELEAMAKTLYDYWFVQFDFPDAKGKPYKTSGGKMVWNEELKREIPDGWEVKRLCDIENNIVTGKTPSTAVEEYFGGDIPFVTIDDIRKQFYIFNSERTLTKLGADSQSSKYLRPGDICVSCIGTIGVIGIVGKECQTNQQINSISITYDLNRYFILNALKKYFEFNSASAKQGAVLVNMNKGDFSDIKILDSTKVLKVTYNSIVSPLYSQIKNNLKQNQELASLRDWLLPMLMNGQVSVGDVEEQLGMVAEGSVEYKKS